MGLFNFLFDNTTKSSSKSQQEATSQQSQTNTGVTATNQNTSQTQNTSQNQTTTGNNQTQQKQQTSSQSNTSGTQTTSNLDPATLAILQQLVPGLAANIGTTAGNANVSALQAIAGTLANNATDNTNTTKAIAAAQDVAKRNFALNEGATIKQTQQQIGSTGNSFSQMLETQGNVDLATNLANIAAQTTLQGQQLNNNDFSTAIAALTGANSADLANSNAPVAQLMSVIQGLSGAQSTTTSNQSTSSLTNLLNAINEATSSTSNADTSSTLAQLLSQLTGSQQTADATAKTSQTGSSTSKSTNTSLGNLLNPIANLLKS